MEQNDLREIVENLAYLADASDSAMIRNIMVGLHPADIAEILYHLDDEHRNYIFNLLDAETASEVINEMDQVSREDLLEELPEDRISEIVDEMESDDATDLVSELPDEMAQKVLDRIDREDSEEVKELLRHEDDTAGGIMAKELIAVHPHHTVDEVIQIIRDKADEVSDLYFVYVVDQFDRLLGVVHLKDLLLAKGDQKIAQIMDRDIISVSTEMDQEHVANIARRYDLVSIPVVDKLGRLTGRITFDDVADVMEEEASEDIQRMAGITTEEEFRETSIVRISQVRLPWLLIGFVGELGSAYVLHHFEASLNQILVAAFFIPIIMAMGGNAGIQSSTIMVRGMATGEIGLYDVKRRLFREFLVSLLNGSLCGLLLFTVVSFWLKMPKFGIILASVLLLVILNASFVGAIVPVILKKINIDPAIATGPFITTSNDVLGLLIYLGTITIFISYL
ncbi:MAG: magnesium transporter [candidate division KSB1 bacterium]|nr:magnesium transporter [candidate division KSB1 bacterium]MDZ7334233.1 magnesium transporter [candidate division KSB1 bacterium]MDZ7356369.1 magnesium transporter [candidate division KSB1 bacterium]MDZ7401061.1 magnesium transporter [candidate division KSB1 bacterium]